MSRGRDKKHNQRRGNEQRQDTRKHRPSAESNNEQNYRYKLPLYKSIQEVFKRVDPIKKHKGNPSLLYDKFIDAWNWQQDDPLNGIKKEVDVNKDSKKDSVIKIFLQGFISLSEWKDLQPELEDYLQRRRELVQKLGGRTIRLRTDWRFMSGTGAHHPLESGFVWHHTLGVPYLPASGVKGVIRAYKTPQILGEDSNPAEIQAYFEQVLEVDELFGYESINNENKLLSKLDTETRRKYERKPKQGSLIVFDAIPTRVPNLELDILNVHYPDYYQQGKAPGDWQSPNPVYFLTVAPDSEFEFALVPIARDGDGRRDKDKGQRLLEKGAQILIEALNSLGAGSKTAIGYGRFRPSGQGNTQGDKAIAISATTSPQGTGTDTNTAGTKERTPRASTVDPKVQTLQMMIDSLRPRDMGRGPNIVDNIASASSDPNVRKELANRLYRKLFPSPDEAKRYQERPWYKKLQSLIEKGEVE